MLRRHMCIIIFFTCIQSLGMQHCDDIPFPEESNYSQVLIDSSPAQLETLAEIQQNDTDVSVTLSQSRRPVRYVITLENCISYFRGWNAHDILRQYHLYQYKPFREYIQMLPEFSAFIIDLNDRMHHALGKQGWLWTATKCKLHRKQLERETNGHAPWIKAYVDSLVEVAREYKETQKQVNLQRQQELQRQREEQERREQEQRRQREVEAYGATLDDLISAWSDPPSDILSDSYQRRIDATRQLKSDDSSSHQKYTIMSEATELLHDLELDASEFYSFHGDILQHTVHSEFVSMVNTLASQHQSYGHIKEIADLNHLAIRASDIGRQYNASGDISNASYIADACWHIVYGLTEATIGTGEGVIQGAGNTGHMISHPIETAENIGHGLAWLVKGVITNGTDACTLIFSDDEAANIAWDSLCDRIRYVKKILEYLRDNASIRNVTREATSLVVEGYLQHKMICSLAEFYSNADQYATTIAEHAPPYQEEGLLQAAEGMYVEVADEAAIEAVESEHNLFSKSHKRRSGSDTTPHRDNVIRVANMHDFFKTTEFGQELKQVVRKTSKRYHGQTVYEVIKNHPKYGLRKGDKFYLDQLHKDHLEIFRKNGSFKSVINLNGRKNLEKSIQGTGRKI